MTTENFVDTKQLKSAHKWHKNGDHPKDYEKYQEGLHLGELKIYTPQERKLNRWEGDVVRRYRNPNFNSFDTCAHCQRSLHEHGWIDKTNQTVCPGDMVLEFPDEVYYPMKAALFEKLFKSVTASEEN